MEGTMKNKKHILVDVIILITFAVVVFWYTHNGSSAEQVIRNHFKWWNEKSQVKTDCTVIKSLRGAQYDFDKIEYVKLKKIVEDKQVEDKQVEDKQIEENKIYFETAAGKKQKYYDSKVFFVTFEIKHKPGMEWKLNDGEHEWKYILVKKKRYSPWLIADYGH